MILPTVYILECADGTYYTGSTLDLERRLRQHEHGIGARYTCKRLPVRLVHVEHFDEIDAAFERERQIHAWSHKKKRALVEGDLERIRKLSECQNETHSANKDSRFGLTGSNEELS